MTSLAHHMLAVAAVVCLPLTAHAYDLTVPTGQIVTLDEQLVVPPENKILYLGFTAPSIGGTYAVSFDRASEDMDVLCSRVGIKEAGKLIGEGVRIDEVVIRLMERLIPYGEVNPDVAQYLNAYDISGGTCVWM